MDFKVAGDKEGITAFQLDIKCEGLSVQTMERALEQARVGRLHILGEMSKALAEPRPELHPKVPRMATFNIEVDSIGKVIGPGGKQIRAVIEDFELANMDVGEDGTIQVSGFSTEKLKEAQEFVMKLVKGGGGRGGGRGPREPRPEYVGPPAEEGKTYTGKITGIHNFGVFLEILPGAEDGSTPGLEGLCHVSELHVEHVRNTEGFLRGMNTDTLEGESLMSHVCAIREIVCSSNTTSTYHSTVVYLGKDQRGKHKLSRKRVLEERGVKPRNGYERGGRGGGGRGGEGRGGRGRGGDRTESSRPAEPAPEMSKGEVDAIASAIESIDNA